MPNPHQRILVQFQQQAEHFKNMIDNAKAVVDNPMTSAEVINEATQTIVDMEANLQRLFDKYGVLPAPGVPVETAAQQEAKQQAATRDAYITQLRHEGQLLEGSAEWNAKLSEWDKTHQAEQKI